MPPWTSTPLVSFAHRLVGTASPSGEEGAVAALVREEMERLGYAVEVDALGTVTGTLGGGDGPCVLLDAHMDTVGVTDRAAWSADPAGELRDGRLYGRGSVDMKGPLAALVHGAAAAAARGRVVVSASIAEEMIEGYATVEVARRVRPDVAVICEPSHRTVVVGQRGRAELIVEVEGRPSHSSRPDLGVNAVDAMADVLRAARELELPEHPALGPAILVVTDVVSRPYPALSVLPDRCTATFDRRTPPGEARTTCSRQLRERRRCGGERARRDRRRSRSGSIASTPTRATPVEAPNFAPAWYTGADAPVARAALGAVGGEPGHWLFCTNGSGTAALGIPTIGFGPGDETLAHRVDEHIELAELQAGRARLRRACRGAHGVSGEAAARVRSPSRAAVANPLAGPLERSSPPAPRSPSIARCPATRRRRSSTRAPRRGRSASRRVLVKDESSRLGLPSFKILGASWAIHRALEDRGDRPRLACATDGNHGRAVARVARQLGLEATVFVPANMIAARREAIARRGRASRGGRRLVRRGGRGAAAEPARS